jgi:hypothetical protein
MSRMMSNLPLAASGIVLGVVYAIVVVLIIVVVCFVVIKLFRRAPRTTPHERGAVGAGEEQIEPDDGTPHTFDT